MLFALHSLVGAAGHDWMTSLNGALPLSQFSIPGTHDSGARFEPFPGSAKCQSLTITEQLNAGVRFLDIRCRHVDNAFTIHHGQVYQNINFTDVLDSTLAFLDANPGETVIMSVKEEFTPQNNNRSFEATFDTYVAQTPSRWLLGKGIPTLTAAKGKIVLFRRFGASSLPKGIDASSFSDNTTFSVGGTLRVQDRYVVPENDPKWAAILALLNEARYGGPDTLYVNFSSGYKTGNFGIPNLTVVSDNINPRLTTFFANNPSGRFGTILMDFADAARCALIYNTNAPAGRAVHHPAYFMIVNRNSGNLTVNLGIWGMSPGLEVNDAGYSTQTDRAGAHALLHQHPDLLLGNGQFLFRFETQQAQQRLLPPPLGAQHRTGRNGKIRVARIGFGHGAPVLAHRCDHSQPFTPPFLRGLIPSSA